MQSGFPGARLREARPLAAGLRNTSYCLELTAAPSPLVLRLYVADPTAACREASILAALGIDAAIPVPGVLFVDGEAEPPFALLEWLEGRDLDEVLGSVAAPAQLELAAACGAVLARIHRVRFPAPGFLGPGLRVVEPLPSWAAYLRQALDGRVGELLGEELAEEVRRVIRERGSDVEARLADAVLVQGDFKPWNLLGRLVVGGATDGWTVSGVLDWEFAFAGSPLFDVATFLRDEAARPPGFGEAFASGYRAEGGVLPPNWGSAARLIDLVNLCQLAEWGDPRQLADVRRLVAETVAGPRSSVPR